MLDSDTNWITPSFVKSISFDSNKLVGIYKTFDITKCITFDPTVYSVNAIQESNAEEEEEEKQN